MKDPFIPSQKFLEWGSPSSTRGPCEHTKMPQHRILAFLPLKSLMGVTYSSAGHGDGPVEKEPNEISSRAAFHQCTLRACSCQSTFPSHRGAATNYTQHLLELWNFNSCPSRLEYQLQTPCKNTEVWSCPPPITPLNWFFLLQVSLWKKPFFFLFCFMYIETAFCCHLSRV